MWAAAPSFHCSQAPSTWACLDRDPTCWAWAPTSLCTTLHACILAQGRPLVPTSQTYVLPPCPAPPRELCPAVGPTAPGGLMSGASAAPSSLPQSPLPLAASGAAPAGLTLVSAPGASAPGAAATVLPGPEPAPPTGCDAGSGLGAAAPAASPAAGPRPGPRSGPPRARAGRSSLRSSCRRGRPNQPPSSAASANPAAAYSARAASLSASTCSHRLSCPHSAAARPTGCAQRATRRDAARACPGSTEHSRSPITYVGRTQHGLALTAYGLMQLEQSVTAPLRCDMRMGNRQAPPACAAGPHPGASRSAAARSRRRGAGRRARPPCWTRSSAAGWCSGRAAAAPPASSSS